MMYSYLESGRGDTLAQQQGPFCSQGSIQDEQAPKIQASWSFRRAKGRQEAGISVSGTSEVIRASSGRQMKALLGGSREIRVCGVWRLLQSPQARLQCWSLSELDVSLGSLQSPPSPKDCHREWCPCDL